MKLHGGRRTQRKQSKTKKKTKCKESLEAMGIRAGGKREEREYARFLLFACVRWTIKLKGRKKTKRKMK